MLKSYYTEQYMGSVLNQYQQNNPQNNPLQQNVSQNCDQIMQNNNWSQSEETKRRLLNESLFKSIDVDLFSRPSMTTTAIQRSYDNSAQRQQTFRTDSALNSSSFTSSVSRRLPPIDPNIQKADNGWRQQMSKSESQREVPKTVSRDSTIVSSYLRQSLPQNRINDSEQSLSYKAKVIDYSRGNEQQLVINNEIQKYGSFSTSVLTERNSDLNRSQIRPNHSFNIQSKPITNKQTVTNVMPKSILKNSQQNSNSNYTKLLSKTNEFSANTTAIKQSYSSPNTKSQINAGFESKQTQPNARFRDTLLKGYEKDGIIKTWDSDRSQMYYCYYCNNYIKKLVTVEKHVQITPHKNNLFRGHTYNIGLNKKFVFGKVGALDEIKSTGLKPETVLKMELDRIPIELKHYYCNKGIRLQDAVGPQAYYCKLCAKHIPSFEMIENHLFSESHRRIEERPTFNKFISQTSEPIIGLQHIIEYSDEELAQPVYECLLCKCFEDSYQMYLHVCSFKHRINLLKQFNPNEVSLNFITETHQSIKEVSKRINDLQKLNGSGCIKKINAIPEQYNQILQSRSPSVEVIDISADEDSRRISKDKSEVKRQFAVKLMTEDEAADAAIVIQSLKESVVKYYLSKIPSQMRRVLMTKVIDGEDSDNYESMDTSF